MAVFKKFTYSRAELECRLHEMVRNGLIFTVEREKEFDDSSSNWWTNYIWDSSSHINVVLGSCAEGTDDVFVSVKDSVQESVLKNIIGVTLIPR